MKMVNHAHLLRLGWMLPKVHQEYPFCFRYENPIPLKTFEIFGYTHDIKITSGTYVEYYAGNDRWAYTLHLPYIFFKEQEDALMFKCIFE